MKNKNIKFEDLVEKEGIKKADKIFQSILPSLYNPKDTRKADHTFYVDNYILWRGFENSMESGEKRLYWKDRLCSIYKKKYELDFEQMFYNMDKMSQMFRNKSLFQK